MDDSGTAGELVSVKKRKKDNDDEEPKLEVLYLSTTNLKNLLNLNFYCFHFENASVFVSKQFEICLVLKIINYPQSHEF